MNLIDKLVNELTKRLDKYSPTSTNYDRIMELKFAKLREERMKKSGLTGYKASEDAWINMTKEEIAYYKSKSTPEERYQTMKEVYYFHDSSAYMRFGDNRLDNYGCNSDKCIPECDYYLEYGRIEDDGTITH